MKNIKVLGSGCRNCEITANVISTAAEQAGVEIKLEKITYIAQIMAYGVMSTPALLAEPYDSNSIIRWCNSNRHEYRSEFTSLSANPYRRDPRGHSQLNAS